MEKIWLAINSKIAITVGKEHTRRRWAGIIFASLGSGKQVQVLPSSFTPQ